MRETNAGKVRERTKERKKEWTVKYYLRFSRRSQAFLSGGENISNITSCVKKKSTSAETKWDIVLCVFVCVLLYFNVFVAHSEF